MFAGAFDFVCVMCLQIECVVCQLGCVVCLVQFVVSCAHRGTFFLFVCCRRFGFFMFETLFLKLFVVRLSL